MEPEDLTPYALTMFEELKGQLPIEISSRLKSSRTVRRHGSASTVYLFNVWDKNQKGLFDPKHFTYCLGYDPKGLYSPTTWYLHLWINTIRIYQYSDTIKQALRDIVHSQCPRGFEAQFDERASQVVLRAGDFSGAPADFGSYFRPKYEELIGSIHPYLMPIIDSFTYDLTREEREEVIGARQRFYTGPRKRLSAEQIREYSRSIPPSWRERILRDNSYKCVHCLTTLTAASTHIDHIRPFSKGGTTTRNNLQPLCGPCNLKKGNRYHY